MISSPEMPSDSLADAPQDKAPAQAEQRAAALHGLRAIAIVVLLFYHFGVPGFGGGFIGIDILFVIAGFATGGALWQEHKTTGQIDLRAFLLTRLRRLAPAFVIMVLCVLGAAALLLLPDAFLSAGKAVIAATLQLSDVFFALTTGYFDAAAQETLFLHLWALSVLAQFFLFMSVAFALLAHRPKLLFVVLGTCFVLSLLGAILLSYVAPRAAFFLFACRAWMFLAGAGLAIGLIERPNLWPRPAMLSGVGLALIAGSVVLTQPWLGVPGWQALIPVVGTLLVLQDQSPHSWVVKGLSLRWCGVLSDMSYSLYLWHWPVFVLTSYVQLGYARLSESLLWMAIAVVLGSLSWQFVEKPTRNHALLSNRALVGATTLAAGIFALLGWAIYNTQGAPARFAPLTQAHFAASQDARPDMSRCRLQAQGPLAGLTVCAIGPQSATPSLLIWGDAHAFGHMDGLAKAARDTGRAGLVVAQAGCAPLFDLRLRDTTRPPGHAARCADQSAQIRAALQQMPHLRDVLLIGRWALYATGQGSGRDSHHRVHLSSPVHGVLTQETLVARVLAATVSEIQTPRRRVAVLRQPPEIAHYNATVMARALAHGRLPEPLAARLGHISVTDALLRARGADQALEQSGAMVLDSWPWFCNPFLCDALHRGEGQFQDHHQLTNAAARRLHPLYYPVMLQTRP